MSDIAMLVAEEYERRTKNFKKEQKGEIKLVSIIASFQLALTQRQRLKEEKKEIANWFYSWEPKTQFAIAASNSFFSA